MNNLEGLFQRKINLVSEISQSQCYSLQLLSENQYVLSEIFRGLVPTPKNSKYKMGKRNP